MSAADCGNLPGRSTTILPGLAKIVLTEDALITDYVLGGGIGPALVNSAIVTAIAILLFQRSKEAPNGVTLVVIGLMVRLFAVWKKLYQYLAHFVGHLDVCQEPEGTLQ